MPGFGYGRWSGGHLAVCGNGGAVGGKELVAAGPERAVGALLGG